MQLKDTDKDKQIEVYTTYSNHFIFKLNIKKV